MANIKRLTTLAKVLEKPLLKKLRKSGRRYSQGAFSHPCGTPACALGNYAHKSEGRFFFEERDRSFMHFNGTGPTTSVFSGAQKEFDITPDEVEELFGGLGCGWARTRKQAAAYVRDFIARKEAEADGAL